MGNPGGLKQMSAAMNIDCAWLTCISCAILHIKFWGCVKMESQDIKRRMRIGKISGLVGIICNFVLAGSKILLGRMAGSMSILADGVNNLSDAGSSFITLIGFRLAEKPADREHPYGHARFEYLASLTVAVMILVVGLELAKSSVLKLLHPEPIDYSAAVLWVLIFSILVKIGMAVMNTILGKKIQSTTLIATAADSRNDVITTGAVLIASLVEHYSGWKIDGGMGILVSLFILYSGFDIAKEAVSPLLGEGANSDLRKQITQYIDACPMVLGCHDLMVHDYGPGRRYASIHVEMDKNLDALICHDEIDRIEKACYEQFQTHLVIHYDPVITDDAEINRVRQEVIRILHETDPRLSIHDFRMLRCEEHIRLLFDMMLPEEMQGREEELRHLLEQELHKAEGKDYRAEITFDLDIEN